MTLIPLPHGRCSLLIRLTGITFLSLGLSLPVSAQSLSDLLAIALKDEPTYQGTVAELRATQARNRQMIGVFLPQITASINTNANQRGYLTRDLNVLEQKDRYNSHSWQVNLSQPLWRYSAIADKEQANALVAKATFELASAEQMLFSKVVEAWLDVLMARDQHDFTLRQEQAAQQQLAMMERGSVLGVHGLPQREEAYSKYLQSQAETQIALADIEIKRAALEQLTGALKSLNLPKLRDSLQLPPLEASSLPDWLNTIIVHNPDIEAARKARDAAREDVSKQAAGFIPTVDLIGNYTQNSQAVGGFPGQNGYDITQSYVGLQANWALFNGGSQFAKVQEAKALLEKAEYALENTRRTVMNNSKQAWYSGLVSQAIIRERGSFKTFEELEAQVSDYEIVIIDTPPYLSKELQQVLAISHLVLIPCKASPFDALAVVQTIGLVQEEQKRNPSLTAAIVFTMTISGTGFAGQIREHLIQHGIPILQTEIANRVAYARSLLFSTSVMEDDNTKAKDEIERLGAEIIALLDKSFSQ